MKQTIPFLMILLFTACNMGENKELKNQNDSLLMATLEKDRQMNELVSTIVEIDENLQAIKEKEQIISLNMASETGNDTRIEDQINQDIQLIYDLMIKNKEKISELEKELKKSGTNNSNLNKLVSRLNKQLKDKTLEIIKLNEMLENKNYEIAGLNFTVDGLQQAIDSLKSARAASEQKLEETTEQLNRAYYVFGTKKELKEQNILSTEGLPLVGKKKVLAENFSEEYFTAIDVREVDSIPLFKSKAKILTNHPESSYTLEKNEEGAMTLKIIDQEKFWSVSKFLVVQVN
ncbi:MAG: hypothetical protein JEZ14_00545 [Marinilabiliaceae bacterium]|nr:hypothetical protein [Marinilabiliaceae bacterium]